jgi:hypothetical protein
VVRNAGSRLPRGRIAFIRVVALEIVVLIAGSAAFLPGGEDLFTFHLPPVEGVHDKVVAALLISALAFPRYGIYSYVTFLMFLSPIRSLPLSCDWAFAYLFMQGYALLFAWTLPPALSLSLMWPA